MGEESNENKVRVTITVAPELLRRIDAVCEARNQARSALIERILKHEIGSEEEFVRDMEHPVYRALLAAFRSSPEMIKLMGKITRETISSEEAERMRDQAREEAELGRARQAAKRQRRKEKGG